VSFLKELSRRNPNFAPIVSTLVCVGIGWERAKSFAEAQQAPVPNAENKPQVESNQQKAPSIGERIDLPLPPKEIKPREEISKDKELTKETNKRSKAEILQTIPLELRAAQKFQNIKTKAQACQLLEGKILTYYDTASLVVSCVQHPVEDAELLNELVYKQRKPVAEVPAHVYRLMPFGEPLMPNQNLSLTTSKVCRELNGQYVTSTGTDYYYIEACKKRSFSTYVELQAHNRRNAPVRTVSPEQLEKLSGGRPIDGSYDREVGALYRIVGDSSLSTLGSADGRAKPVRSAEELDALPQNSNKNLDLKKLCSQYNNKVVSFYSQLFFITNCQKRPVKELPIAIQQRFAERGASITDLSSGQLNAIPTGKELSEDEAASLIK